MVEQHKCLVFGQQHKVGHSEITGDHFNSIHNPRFCYFSAAANAVATENVFYLSCLFNGTNLPLNNALLVNLHLSVWSQPGAQQGDCTLVLHDVNSNSEVTSKDLPCASSNSQKLVLQVTTQVKQWITTPSSNAGMKVTISANNAGYPGSSLPFVRTDAAVEPPYYVLFL